MREGGLRLIPGSDPVMRDTNLFLHSRLLIAATWSLPT
jgi:hypothetical protein